MLPILQIGPLALRTSGLLLLIGVYLGLGLAERRLPKEGLTPNQLYNLTFLAAIAGVLGARLFFVAQNFSLFRNSPLNVFSLDASLLDPFGGIAAALIASLIYGQRKGLAFWSTLDAFTPALAVFAVFVGLAHLASGQAFGAPTTLPWGINLWGATRHPSQIYETLAALVILAFLWRRSGRQDMPGRLFLLFIVMSAGARLLLEAWRGDSSLTLGGLRLAQVIAWAMMAGGIFLLERKSAVLASGNTGE
ncbi:MAG: prolipoprotein diacylglyceryl transferase [Chloroflexi bacterium]|nr:prolipoprotein diacylglyceryl transferase [Chloroflexota bacterium]